MGRCIDWAALEQVHLADSVWALFATALWDRFFDIIEPTYLEFTLELCSTFQLQTVMTEFDDPITVQFHLGGLVRQLSVPEFGVALGLYTDEFMEADNFPHLYRHIHYSLSSCWAALIPATGIYDPSPFKVSSLSPALRYLHAILAHTLIERREGTGVVNTHDVYFLWSMRQGHVFDLAYFISLAFRHQTEQHKKRVICIGPYVNRLARHFGLLNTSVQSSSLTLIGQMSLQGISSMLQMRMIECRCGFDPP